MELLKSAKAAKKVLDKAKNVFKDGTKVISTQPIGLMNNKPQVPVGTKGVVKNKTFPVNKRSMVTIDFDKVGELKIKYDPDNPAIKKA